MIKKYVSILILCLASVTAILSGCNKMPSFTEPVSISSEPTSTNILDLLHQLSPGTVYDVDNSTLSEEEYHLRTIVNSLGMYHEVSGQRYEIKMNGVEQYGIHDYARFDDWYSFDSLEDMITVLDNPDFRQDFHDTYGYDLSIESYAFPAQSICKGLQLDVDPIHLIVWPDDYNLRISMTGFRDGEYYYYGMFDTRYRENVKALMEFYADLDGYSLGSAVSDGGWPVYYVTTNKGGVFFQDLGIQTTIDLTAYIWQQEDVIGVFVTKGVHKPENLDFCVLERHEI